MITRKTFVGMTVAAVATFATVLTIPAQAVAAESPMELWYPEPAKEWIEALPIGNGRLGAMVFGQPGTERLQLNDATVWSGGPDRNADRPDAYKKLPELRRLLREGKYSDAERFANDNWNGPAPYDASYQTLGDLTIDFKLPDGEVADYRRNLDIAQAVAGVRYRVGSTTFTREAFASAADGVIVQRITADRAGSVAFTLGLSRQQGGSTRVDGSAELVISGSTGGPLKYESRVRVLTQGGRVEADGDNKLRVEGADEAVILLSAATNYKLDYDAGYLGGDLAKEKTQLQAASGKSYAQLREAHVKEYQRYFNRLSIDLGGNPQAAELPTEQRLKDYKTNQDPSMAALFFQYGRYLLISCSRPENPLPANLQGIWGDGFDLPWKSDFHTNINVQMIYWPAEVTNLSETHLPLLALTNSLVKPGTKTAKAYFGPTTPGWVLGYTTNAWGWTSPGVRLSWGIWTGGSGWLCQHLWEHYAFTRDVDYLRSVYPTMKSASEFWLANLVESPTGTLIVSPSSSPENNFTTDSGVNSTLTEGATMERAIVWDLLDNTASAAAVLKDDDFAKRVRAARDRIEPLRIGKLGQLMEWNGDWEANARDPHHRHVSHLYPLHPGHQITENASPELLAAARKTLEMRGDDGTGWSLAWKINFWARLRDGDRALRLIGMQLRHTTDGRTVMSDAGGTYPNLFDAHPPFQLDGNMGYVAGVAGLLLQSHERYVDQDDPRADRYYIDVLPALPTVWSAGSVRGLRARGGFELDLQWREHKLVQLTVRAMASDSRAVLRYGDQTRTVRLNAGESISLNPTLEPIRKAP